MEQVRSETSHGRLYLDADFIVFLFYCFLGWIFESVYVSIVGT